MKKFHILLVSIFVSTVLAASSSAAITTVGDPGRSWAQPDDAELGLHIQQFIEAAPNEIPSFLVHENVDVTSEKSPICNSPADENCVGKALTYSAVLPKCSSENEVNCTVDFGIISDQGEKQSAVFSRYFPERAENQYKGDPLRNLPDGVAGSIYSIPQAPHDGGDKYYISAVVTGGINQSGPAYQSGFEIRITPIALEASGYFSNSPDERDAGWARIKDANTGDVRWGLQGAGYAPNQFCIANSWREKLCAQKYAFPADTRFYVTVRLSQAPGGWMHGRISSPDIQISSSGTFSTLEFKGNPIAVPTIYKLYKYPEMPDELKKFYDVERGGYKPSCGVGQEYCAGGRSGPSKNPLNRNVIISPDPWDRHGMDQLKIWLPFVDDKATALPSFWSVRTLSENEMSDSSQCFKNKSQITGIVTTNSTQYSAGPPSFDKSEGTLNYQVAAPHYGTAGDVFKGSYDLVMRSDVARCVYGFSKAPIQATLSITSADGAQQVATTVIGERSGWLYLTAKNFEFSAPIIKAKLTQEADVATPTAGSQPTTGSPQASIKKKSTISCVKGKQLKKVTSVSPKCPVGFKKKA